MAARVKVMAGAARSGKTELLLRRYREVLAAGPVGAGLWIGPNHLAVADARDRLLDPELPACLAPALCTFFGFAEQLLAAAPRPVSPIGEPTKHLLLQRIVQQLARDKKLSYFAPVAQSDGLVELAADQIEELKRAEIWPGELLEQSRGDRKTAELVAIYEAYQKLLNANRLYDKQGRFWAARSLLQESWPASLRGLKLVVVDGFTDFTKPQYEILQSLAERVSELIVSLPLPPKSARTDLFAKPAETLHQLQERFSGLEIEVCRRRENAAGPTLDHIERELFGDPRRVRPPERVEQIEILPGAGVVDEVELVARRIKKLIVSEKAAPQEILVVFRTLWTAAPLVREVFDRMGLALAMSAEAPLGDSPAIKALTGLLRLKAEDWPARRLQAVLTSSYFRLARRDEMSAAEVAVRQLPPWSHQASLLSMLQNRSQCSRSLQVIQRLAAALDRLPQRATLPGWAAAVEELAKETGLLSAISASSVDAKETAEPARHDKEAWQRLMQALKSAGQWSIWLQEPEPRHCLAELVAVVENLSAWESLPTGEQPAGAVRVLDANSARATRAKYLFFAGLSEQAVPAANRQDPLLNETDRALLKTAGLPLTDHRDHSRAEMLLFYEVVTRATERLYLSYPAWDQKAQPLSPSPYLTEVDRICGPGRIRRTAHPDLRPVPADDDLWSPSDLRVKAVHEAAGGRIDLLASLLAESKESGRGENLLAGLETTHQRQRGGSFAAYEGVFAGARARQELLQRFGPEHRWSPSQLESYAACPYRFLLEKVLRLQPLEEMELGIDPARRGWRWHETLSRLHRRLNAEYGEPTSPTAIDEAEFNALFAEVLQEVLDEPSGGGEWVAAEKELDRRTLMTWAAEYYQQHVAYDQEHKDAGLLPTHFEVPLGSDSDSPEETLRSDEPVPIEIAGETILLVGRVDRIDRGTVAGQPVFTIIDHKTGSRARKVFDEENSTALQLPLYTLAIEQLLHDQQAVAWKIGYWNVRGKGLAKSSSRQLHEPLPELLQPTPQWDEMRRRLHQQVSGLIEGIRNGHFPMYSADPECTRNCPFNTVCRVGQVRALGKTWPPEEDPEPA